MLHDIAPHVYSNAFHPHPARLEDKTLCFAQGGVYLREDGSFPLRRDYPAAAEVLYLFDYDGAGVYLSREAPLGCTLRPVRALRELAQPDAFLGGTAQHLSDWYGMTRFCGRCGAKMTHSATERAMVCPACGNAVIPDADGCAENRHGPQQRQHGDGDEFFPQRSDHAISSNKYPCPRRAAMRTLDPTISSFRRR